jgi:2',3'-cyclic-nucleotide 2'-phosphodiesterase (5'-nucleotidase family)
MKFYIILLLGAGLWACSSVSKLSVSVQPIAVNDTILEDLSMLQFIQPYKDSLEREMNLVIGYAAQNLVKERPGSALMNWTADALLHFGRDSLLETEKLMISLLNYGGIRSSIDKGDISISTMYKLMPFDNLVVAVELPIEILDSLHAYMLTSGGEAIGGGKFIQGKFVPEKTVSLDTTFWLVTNDYLYHGGDQMTFLDYGMNTIFPRTLLRDIFIHEVISQDTLVVNQELRFLR